MAQRKHETPLVDGDVAAAIALFIVLAGYVGSVVLGAVFS